MTEDAPIRIEGREWERGLWWMVLASGAVHVLLIALALLAPLSFVERRTPLVSYTVDLIAPDRVGGTNIVPGGRGRTTAPPLTAAQPAAEAPAPAVPSAPKVEEPKPAPKVEAAKAPEPQPEPPKAEPAKAEPQQVAAKPEPKPPPPPKVEEPKPQPKPKEPEPKAKVAEPKPNLNDMVVKDKAKKAELQPSPPAASPKAVAKAEPAKPPSPKAAAQSPPGTPEKGTQPKSVDQGKAGPADAKSGGAGSDLDTRIAAAVKRVEQQAGVRGGGLGSKPGEQPGGPIAVGPGEGVGGTVAGLEYLLYLNQLQARLKQNWAWAGTDRNRKAVVRFGILETGEVVDVRITETSGDPNYDASVERAVRAANPMPPPPEAYRKQFSDVEYTFTPEAMEM